MLQAGKPIFKLGMETCGCGSARGTYGDARVGNEIGERVPDGIDGVTNDDIREPNDEPECLEGLGRRFDADHFVGNCHVTHDGNEEPHGASPHLSRA